MTDLGALLARVAQNLDRRQIPYMVIGGFANLVWGEPRTTMDLDITVDVEAVGLPAFAALAQEIGDPLPDDPVAFAERTRVLPVRSEGVIVDFVLATLPFEFDAIRRARTLRVGEADVAICSPEDLIVHKAVSSRARDHEDIVGILKRQGERSLGVAGLDQIIGGLAAELGEPEVAERYRRAKSEAGWADHPGGPQDQ